MIPASPATTSAMSASAPSSLASDDKLQPVVVDVDGAHAAHVHKTFRPFDPRVDQQGARAVVAQRVGHGLLDFISVREHVVGLCILAVSCVLYLGHEREVTVQRTKHDVWLRLAGVKPTPAHW